jgi:hypothetical protein
MVEAWLLPSLVSSSYQRRQRLRANLGGTVSRRCGLDVTTVVEVGLPYPDA